MDCYDVDKVAKASYIIAQAAVLNARVAGMLAENRLCEINNAPPVYTMKDFDSLIQSSGCGHNDVIEYLFH